MQPLAVDLFSGLGGWAEGLESEGYHVRRYDIADMFAETGTPKPADLDLVLRDVLTIHGSELADADLIVASPPCQEFSYMAMPWSLAKEKAARIRADETGAEMERLNALFNACFRIQREACEASGRQIPMVVENVRGAQPWVGRAKYNFGSFYLWGDVPCLMPRARGGGGRARQKSHEGEQWNVNRKNFTGTLGWDQSERGDDGRKVPGFRFDGSGGSFQTASVDGMKVASEDGRRTDIGKGARFTSRDCGVEGLKHGGDWFSDPSSPSRQGGQVKVAEGRKGAGAGAGAEWFDGNLCVKSSNSTARKLASAQIAKIPWALSTYIGEFYNPHSK